jgi:hypothetical protein
MSKLHQLEDKRTTRKPERDGQREGRRNSSGGLAAAFSEEEIKNLFFGYLTTMLLVEGLIFFFSFINHLASEGSVFPWKPYLFATFIAPVAITFVFGLILLTFNRFFYGRIAGEAAEDSRVVPASGWRKGERVTTFFHLIHRLPLLFSMVLLIAATALAYKLEAILLYLAAAGAVTAKYLFFSLIGLLFVAALGIAVWMLLSYRLRDRTLAADHEYRMKLIDQFGLVQLEDGTVLDRQGKVVHGRPYAGDELLGLVEELPALEESSDGDDRA